MSDRSTRRTPAEPTAPDVSVVIATYRARDRILATLDSIAHQTLASERFEVVVVANGPDDGTQDLVRRARAFSFPASLRLLTTAVPSAANARNLGIRAARGRYVTFVDDDDLISPQFLETLLKHARPGSVTLAPLADVADHGQPVADFNNYLNRAAFRYAGETVPFAKLSDAASANAGKLVLTEVARRHLYPTSLSSGEDVAFWSTVLASEGLDVAVVPPAAGAVYYRLVREQSVSRTLDRTFALNRLEIIGLLGRLAVLHPEAAAPLGRLMNGQASNLARYIRQHPEDHTWVLDQILEHEPDVFPYHRLNAELTDHLVVAYAFPPYSDTSAMVVARRLCVARQPVDVLTHAMDNIRSRDPLSLELTREVVGSVMTVPGSAVFANWRRIAKFATAGTKLVAERERQRRRPYASIYSRTMWPAAHVMAALYKVRNPAVRWTAEFSDPMRIDSAGKVRESLVPEDDPVFDEIERHLRLKNLPTTDSRNMWEWVENIAYALADEVVFTNRNQREFMLDHSAVPMLRARVEARSTIHRHPTLPPRFYAMEPSSYALPADRINLGYFGVFYGVRGIGDILGALEGLTPDERSGVMLHVFTNRPDDTRQEVATRGLEDCVSVQPYVPYLEFLELTRHFDWLVVTDARVADVHGINPYLPSKYSDYVGSGAKIWSIVEPGSVLSTIDVDAMTSLGDVEGARQVLIAHAVDVAAPRSGQPPTAA